MNFRIYKTAGFVMAALALAQAAAFAGEKDRDRDRGGDRGGGGGGYPDWSEYFRLDCRFHNEEGIPGISFCYASAVYRTVSQHCDWEREDCENRGSKRNGQTEFIDVNLGIGCDNTTLFNDKGWVHVETTLDRLSPLTSATPAVEIFPQGQLATVGTYTSVLDIFHGRMKGLCYVRKVEH